MSLITKIGLREQLLNTVLLFVCIYAFPIFQEGMFMDGLYYATISRNISENLLHPFDLHFMDQHFDAFFEHPPLAFFLQGIFFKVFGNAVYTERIYALVALFIQLLLLAKIYRRALPHQQHAFWLPMFLYTSVYSVFWAFSNNMLENTLGIFMLLSILLFQIYTANKKVIFLVLSGLTIFLGFITKGPTSLFPFAAPGFYFLTNNSITKSNFLLAAKETLILVLSAIAFFLLMYLTSEKAAFFFDNYFNVQIVNSLKNVTTVANRFHIIERFFWEILPPLIICCLIFFLMRKKVPLPKSPSLNMAIFFFLLALSGVLPIMLSMKQSTFYINIAFAFLALGLGIILNDMAWAIGQKIKHKNLISSPYTTLSLFAFISILSYSGSQFIKRDKDIVSDVKEIKNTFSNLDYSACPELISDWKYYGYLSRYTYSNLNQYDANANKYLLGKKNGICENDSVYQTKVYDGRHLIIRKSVE